MSDKTAAIINRMNEEELKNSKRKWNCMFQIRLTNFLQ